MRLIRFEHNGKMQVGIKTELGVFSTGYGNMIDLIKDGNDGLIRVQDAVKKGKQVEHYKLLAPIERPGKVLCSGINYVSHKQENPQAVFPKKPSFFSKLPSSIIGPNQSIILPESENQVDYEVELALVIGKRAKNVVKEHALDHVFGYTVINDVSARDLQFQLQHETIGKGADTFCPVGPVIVTSDEIGDLSTLRVSSYVNDEQRQSCLVSDMLFDIPFLIEFLSAYMTLEPGDLISTGTPAGVGCFRNPPVYLKPGDKVEVEVDRIGKLVNIVASGWES